MEEKKQGKKIVRFILIGLSFLIVLILMIMSVNYKPPVTAEIWNPAMTKGDNKSKPYIMYTDIACPYCMKFAEAVNAHKDDFNEKYIDNGKIRFEIRVTDYLYENGKENSKSGGESAYCAANQDKFWPYYEALTHQLYEDYYSKDENAPVLANDYYINIATKAGIDKDKFVKCLDNHETEDELTEVTQKAEAAGITGMPSFIFNGVSMPSGFGGTWDMNYNYELAKKMINSQL
ncbi:thioredoxin domain-containing protein [Candidatus Saccharibacteria bacterium]|nr:thioredoxin domain-containing protein [Candidatus Saccharibacteria bacterium]